jgi:hypothetical protein
MVVSRINSYINIRIYNNGTLVENSFSINPFTFINSYLFSIYMKNQ